MDVPNATLMVIENAERFGLSQLHQLRGRVGRGSAQSYCVLVSGTKNEETKKRLQALCKTTDGFQIAEQDLALRGPGDFFGSRQHGLPLLKVASLQMDLETLQDAQQAAAAVIQTADSLNAPELAPLKAKSRGPVHPSGGQFELTDFAADDTFINVITLFEISDCPSAFSFASPKEKWEKKTSPEGFRFPSGPP